MATRLHTSAEIEAEITRLKARLVTTRAAEADAKLAELAALIRRGGLLDEALEWARARAPAKVHHRTAEASDDGRA